MLRYRDINSVVMDYLVSEGYPRAAEKFAKEANLKFPVDEESMRARVEIRRAIHIGDIDTAITKINDLNPQVSAPLYIHNAPLS
jgi:hypothetical protein